MISFQYISFNLIILVILLVSNGILADNDNIINSSGSCSMIENKVYLAEYTRTDELEVDILKITKTLDSKDSLEGIDNPTIKVKGKLESSKVIPYSDGDTDKLIFIGGRKLTSLIQFYNTKNTTLSINSKLNGQLLDMILPTSYKRSKTPDYDLIDFTMVQDKKKPTQWYMIGGYFNDNTNKTSMALLKILKLDLELMEWIDMEVDIKPIRNPIAFIDSNRLNVLGGLPDIKSTIDSDILLIDLKTKKYYKINTSGSTPSLSNIENYVYSQDSIYAVSNSRKDKNFIYQLDIHNFKWTRNRVSGIISKANGAINPCLLLRNNHLIYINDHKSFDTKMIDIINIKQWIRNQVNNPFFKQRSHEEIHKDDEAESIEIEDIVHKDGIKIGTIICTIIGCIVFLFLIAVTISIYLRKKREIQRVVPNLPQSSNVSNISNTANSITAVEVRQTFVPLPATFDNSEISARYSTILTSTQLTTSFNDGDSSPLSQAYLVQNIK